MKTAVIGTGKTGGAVAELLGKDAITFDKENPPEVDTLKQADIAIVFVPGEAASEIIDLLLEAKMPAVWGTTGFKWPADLPDRVKKINARWVIGSNFSLGMNLVRKAINMFGEGAGLLRNPDFHIHEVHHIHKQDAPSGTALSWHEWLGKDAAISSAREGDVKGMHELHIKTEYESIYLKHEAHNRKLFAEGAIWTAKYLMDNPQIEAGVYKFSSIFDQAFNNQL